MITSYETEGEK